MSECFGSWGCLSVSIWTSATCPCVTSFVFLGTLKGWNETKLWPGTHPSAGWMIPVRVPDGRAWRGLWIWAQIRVHSRWFDWKDEILNWIQNKEPAAKTRDSLKATKASKSSEYPQLLTLTLIHYTASCCRAAAAKSVLSLLPSLTASWKADVCGVSQATTWVLWSYRASRWVTEHNKMSYSRIKRKERRWRICFEFQRPQRPSGKRRRRWKPLVQSETRRWGVFKVANTTFTQEIIKYRNINSFIKD